MTDLAFDLRYVRYALLVAEHGSFRRVADLLNLSSSTVSRRIELLESRLGIPIFERSRSGARLTPAGEHFIRDAEIAVSHLSRAMVQMRMIHYGQSGEIRVGIATSLTNSLLLDIIREYRKTWPRVEIKFEESGWQTASSRVLSGHLDVAIIPKGDQVAGCESLALWDEPVVIAVSSNHTLASSGIVTWEELRDETFLISADAAGADVQRYLMNRFASRGLDLKIFEHTVSRENLLNIAAQGFGVFPTLVSALSATRDDLVFLQFGEEEETIGIHAIWIAGKQIPLVHHFVDLARSKLRR